MGEALQKKREARRSRGRPKPVAPARVSTGRAKRLTSQESERRGRQVIRQLLILSALSAAPRGLTVKELLGVVEDGTSRTLYRDLAALQAARFALTSEGGRWAIDPKARIDVPIDPDEIVALVMARDAIHAFAAPLRALRRKLLASLSPAAREFCEQLAATAAATTVGSATASTQVVDAAREAIAREHLIAITHAKPGQPAQRRVVEPYATWSANGRPYLIARCPENGELRHFHFARIGDVQVLDEAFDRDASFRLDEYVARGFGAYHGPAHDVSIELASEVAHVARENQLGASQEVEALAGGRALLRLRTAGLPPLAAWIAGFGGKARAVEPAELVEMVRVIGEGAAGVHALR